MTVQEMAELYSIVLMPGYGVLLQLFEEEKRSLIDDMAAIDPHKQAEVLAAQAIAHGFAKGIANVRARINTEMENFKLNLTMQKPDEITQILSPFGDGLS